MDPITSSWADLPSELLESILERLFGKDCTVFLAVCKHWRSTPSPRIKHIDAPVSDIVKHPFLLRFRRERNEDLSSYCELYSPAYNKVYLIHSFDRLLGDAHIYSSGYGWLLLARRSRFFFLNPSTGNVMDLPRLPEYPAFHYNRMGFSAPPTSPDCVVFGLIDMFDSLRIRVYISYLRRGDSTWSHSDHTNGLLNKMMRQFISKRFVPRNNSKSSIVSRKVKGNRCKIPFIRCGAKFKWCCSSSPVLHNGSFYCLSKYGVLGVYNPENCDWRLINNTKHKAFLADKFDEPYLMESCNGELISVVVGARGESIRVLKFDENLNMWHNVSSLEDQVIFLSRSSCMVMHCDELQVKGLQNTIHFSRLHGNCNIFYSLSTKKYHTFDGSYASEDLWDTKLILNCTWLVPNFNSFSAKELDWSSLDIDELTMFEEAVSTGHMRHPNDFIRDLTILQPTDSSNCKILYAERKRSSATEQEAQLGRPWIMLHHEGGEVVCTLIDIFRGFSNHPVHHLEARLRGKKTYASGYGQLLMMDMSSGDCILLDTSSSSSTAIRSLPILETSYFNYKCSSIYLSPQDSRLYVIICGVFKNEDEDWEMVMFRCQVGDNSWTLVAGGSKVRSIAVCDDKIYAIRVMPVRVHVLVELEVQLATEIETFQINKAFKFIDAYLQAPRGSAKRKKFLVESCGELLLFHVAFAGYEQDIKVISKIQVFKVDRRRLRMKELKNLGDRAFFITNAEHCFGCCASEAGLKKNNIYFTCSRDEHIYKYDYGDDSISTCLYCPEIKS
ncbi:F-box/kelch-repeat protein At1g57790, partial [Linum perenne]